METKVAKVSVLIPAYNYARYLPEAIDSVLAQSFQDFELIIVDNCSTDDTVEVVKEYIKKDPRIKLHINETNIGMYRNYNQALLLAKGEYIKFLNADDKFHPELLEKFTQIFDTYSNVSIVTSYRQLFGDKTDLLKPDNHGLMKAPDAIIKALAEGNWIGEPTTVMFKRENLTLGLFDISLLQFADFDMWLRQMQVGNIYILNDVLSYFRIHTEQGTEYLNTDKDKILFNEMQLQEYRRYALQINRFGLDIDKIFATETHSIMQNIANKSLRNLKYIFSNQKYSNKMRNLMNSMFLIYLAYIPKKLFKKITTK